MQSSNQINSISGKKKVVRFIVLGVFLFIFSTIIGLTLYSRLNAGNFVLFVDPNVVTMKSIKIADNASFDQSSTSLDVESNIHSSMTYASIKIEDILQTDGQYIDLDHSYMAYSFYIKNTSSETITVRYYMRLTEVYNMMDEYVRILIIEDGETSRMYQKADQEDDIGNTPNYNQLPHGTDFLTNNIVFRDIFEDFKPGAIKSFKVIIWLEEQDPDMDASYQIGIIRAQLVFAAEDNYEVVNTQSLSVSSEYENMWITLSPICNVNFRIYYEAEDNS